MALLEELLVEFLMTSQDKFLSKTLKKPQRATSERTPGRNPGVVSGKFFEAFVRRRIYESIPGGIVLEIWK